MLFTVPRPRPARETILPMINVVFLLLIFFLMTAQIAPAPPFDLSPPEAEGETVDQPSRVLWLGADGQMIMDDFLGEAALEALAGGEGPVLIRADARARAADLARLMRRLSALGIDDLGLATLSRGSP